MVEESFAEMILMIFFSILFIKEIYFEFCDFVKFSLRCAFLSACSSKCFTTGTCGLFVISTSRVSKVCFKTVQHELPLNGN